MQFPSAIGRLVAYALGGCRGERVCHPQLGIRVDAVSRGLFTAWPSQQRQARRRRGWGVFWVLVIVGVVLIVMNPAKSLSWLIG